MNVFKKFFCFMILFIGAILIVPNSVLALEYSINVDGEELYVESGINSMFDDTVIYDASTNTLTLDNYNGGVILVDLAEELTIVLNGTNVITGYGDSSGFYSFNDLVFTGNGSLEINDVLGGIVDDGNLEIDGPSLIINAIKDGIFVDGGNVIIDGNVTIDSEGNGLYIYGLLSVNGGIIKVNAVQEAVFADSFVINDGIMYVTSLFGGVGSNTSIDINGGYLNVKVPLGGYAMAVLGSEDIEFNINPDMVILPAGISLQEDSLEIFDEVIYGIALGEDGASIGIDFDTFDYLLDKIANEVIIKKNDVQYGKLISEVPENINILSSNLSEIIPLSDSEKVLYENGIDLSIILSMNETNSLSDENLIKENLGNNLFLKSFDLSIFKKIGGLESQIYDLNSPITLSIKLDDEFINKDNNKNRVYKVLRVHDGEVSVIDTNFDASTGFLSFETDKFSSYALVYSDSVVMPNPNTYDNVNLYFSILCLSLSGFMVTNLYLKKQNA